jgi:hypothetical protein
VEACACSRENECKDNNSVNHKAELRLDEYNSFYTTLTWLLHGFVGCNQSIGNNFVTESMNKFTFSIRKSDIFAL